MSLVSVNPVKIKLPLLAKRFSLVTLILVFISFSGYGQEFETEEVLLDELSEEVDYLVERNDNGGGKTSKAHLLQLGDYNSSSINQDNSGSFSRPNVGLVFQQGAHNEVYILQAGSGNKSTAAQFGYGNDYELHLVGDENNTNVIQHGAKNSVEQYIDADGVDYTVIQQGLNNELIQVERNPEMPAYTVYQRGVGISIVIENYSVY